MILADGAVSVNMTRLDASGSSGGRGFRTDGFDAASKKISDKSKQMLLGFFVALEVPAVYVLYNVVDTNGVPSSGGCNMENVGWTLVLVEFRSRNVLVVVVATVLGDSANMANRVDLVLVETGGSLDNNVVVIVWGGRCDPSRSCLGGCFFRSTWDCFSIPCLCRRVSSFVRIVSGGLDKPLKFGATALACIVACTL